MLPRRATNQQVSMMPKPDLLHPDIETLSAGALRRHQDGAWPRQWDYVRARSDFYRRKLGKTAAGGLTLDGLQDLPFTDKEEIKDSQAALPPFGDYVACDPTEIVRLHRTSGTTGRGMNLAYTRHDAELAARLGGRAMHAAGLRPGDRVVHCLNYCLWTGGVTDHMILEAAGATVIPFGVGNTRAAHRRDRELGATAISCTPSYPALIEKTLAEEGELNPRDLGLRLGLFGGEGGLDNAGVPPPARADLGLPRAQRELRPLRGDLDPGRPVRGHQRPAFPCRRRDLRRAPGAGDRPRLPIREGAGELVATHLRKECQPLIRYRTRDVLTVTGTGPCGCWRSGWRFRVTGRTDDMFNVRGVNVFPSAVRAVIADQPALCSGHFRIRLAGPGPYDRIELTVEAATALPSALDEAARAIEAIKLGSPLALKCAWWRRNRAAHRGQDVLDRPQPLRSLGHGNRPFRAPRRCRHRHAEPARAAERDRRRGCSPISTWRWWRRHDAAVGAIVLAGAGRAFCAGDDLKEFGQQSADPAATEAHIRGIQQITRDIMFAEKVVVGAVQGYAVGGGFEWMLNCDLVVAADDLVAFFPEMEWAQFTTGGVTHLLPLAVGHQRAMELLVLGERQPARLASWVSSTGWCRGRR